MYEPRRDRGFIWFGFHQRRASVHNMLLYERNAKAICRMVAMPVNYLRWCNADSMCTPAHELVLAPRLNDAVPGDTPLESSEGLLHSYTERRRYEKFLSLTYYILSGNEER